MNKKNKKVNKNKLSESDLETDSDNLSEELKQLIGHSSSLSNSNTKNKILINNDTIPNDKTPFDITTIYSEITNCFQKYRSVMVKGEITAFKISDDNAWITIKSLESVISGIFWKISKDLKYQYYKTFKVGDQISFNGNFSIMKKNLSIYLNIKSMEKTGKGDYMDIYEQYRIKIRELGLGLPKKSLNCFPYSIGIITALEGAAIQDILQTFKLDNFKGNIIIKNSIVQGINCPKSIINSIEWFEQNYLIDVEPKIDLLMITRGGGSYEDLVGFSDWDLLNKIANTKFITLSAVGHQIDNQLSDEVSDLKFATPSIGAKYVIEVQNKYKYGLSEISQQIDKIKFNYLKGKDRLEIITRNIDSITKSYELKIIIEKTRKYSEIIKSVLNKYTQSKIKFLHNLSNIKCSITRYQKNTSDSGSELISIRDFINVDKDKPISPKKIEIKFIDGMINISYKIIDYVQFK